MKARHKNGNDLELEAIEALRAEGRFKFKEIAGPLRHRMSERTTRPTRPTPWVVRVPVVAAALAAVGLLFLVELTG